MKNKVAILVIACILSVGCGGPSQQPRTLNKQSEPKLRIFYEPPAIRIIPSGDPEADCRNWTQNASSYSAQTNAGYVSYSDCDYDGEWDMASFNSEAKTLYQMGSREAMESRVKNKLFLKTSAFIGFLDSDKDIIRGTQNGTAHICVPNPNNRNLKVCGDDTYILRGSEAARPYDQQYRLFVETYKLQMEAESPPPKR